MKKYLIAFTNEELKVLLENEEYDNFMYIVKQMDKDDIIELMKDLLIK